MVTVLGGKRATAKVPLTITSGGFSTFNHKAPARCTLTFTATVAGSIDPTPANAVATVEINIADKNDTEGTARHESLIKSIAPVKITLPRNGSTTLKTVRPTVVNADCPPARRRRGTRYTTRMALEFTTSYRAVLLFGTSG